LKKSHSSTDNIILIIRAVFWKVAHIITLTVFLSALSIDALPQSILDSLLTSLSSSQGVERIDLCNELSYEYSFVSIDDAKSYAEQANNLADSFQYKPGKARALQRLGLIAYLEGIFVESERYCMNSLEVALEINDYHTAHECYNTLAILFEESNAYDKSFENYRKAHEIILNSGDSMDIARSFLSLGMISRKQLEKEVAVNYLNLAWGIYKRMSNHQGMANSLAEIGKLYYVLNNPDTAVTLLLEADRLSELSENEYISLKVSKYLVEYYRDAGIPDSAIYFGEKALNLSIAIRDPVETQGVLSNLSEDYAAAGKYDEARDYHQQYSLLRDSLFRFEGAPINRPPIEILQDRVVQEDIPSDQLFDQWSENYMWVLVISGGLLVLVIFLILFNRYRDKSTDIKIIEEQKDQLLELSNQLENKEESVKDLKERNQRLRKQNQALRELHGDDEFDEVQVETKIFELSRIIADNLEADSVGIWEFIDDDKKLEALDQYNKKEGEHVKGEVIETEKFPLYFEALKNSTSMKASNAGEDSIFAEFNQDGNQQYEIKSRMDVPITYDGKILGVIWVEFTGNFREFQDEDEGFLLSTASMVGELLDKQRSSLPDTSEDDDGSSHEKAVYESHYTRLKGIIASLNASVLVVDTNLDIVLFNPEAEAEFGYNSDQVLSENISVILKEGTENSFYTELKEHISGGQNYFKVTRTIEYQKSDGTSLGGYSGVSMVGIENEKYITFILFPSGTEEPLVVEQSGNVYDYFILDQDELVRESLNKVILEIVEWFDTITNDNVVLHYTEKDLPLTSIYRNKLTGAIKMVLLNALKSIGENGDIYIQPEVRDNSVFLSIVDTGEGLSNEKRKLSFEPFVMDVDAVQLRGMGLVKWVVELHGGKVKINSRLGRGTEVIMNFPVDVS